MATRSSFGIFQKARPLFHVGIDEELVGLYRKAMKVATEKRPHFQPVLGGIANLVLSMAYAKDKEMLFQDEQVIQQIRKAQIIMLEQIDTKVSPEMVAEQLNMSYSAFRKQFKKYTGLAPVQYIQELKLQQAKNLLRTTQYSIKEIAFMMNFENSEYFSVFFKKKQHQTPLEYRNFSMGLNR